MSVVDLMILGLIKNQPMSAYDLVQLQGMHELLKISQPAIYRNVRKLEEKGLLTGEPEKTGNMPEKRVYTITADGESHIHKLMEQTATQKPGIYFEFNVFILLIEHLPKDLARLLLQKLHENLEANLAHLKSQAQLHAQLSVPIRKLAEQHIELNQVLIEWLDGFIVEFEKM